MNRLSAIGNQEQPFGLPTLGNLSVGDAKGETDRKGGSVFAGDLELLSEIDQRKQRGRTEAMRIVSDAFDREKAIDKKVERMRGRVSEIKGEIRDYQKELDGYRSNLETIKKDHGFDDEDQLEADLELYEKYKTVKEGGTAEFTEEETERLKDLDLKGLEAYTDMSDRIRKTEERLNHAKDELAANVSGIEAIHIERLKTHGMVDATLQKDAKMDALGREVMGMAVSAAKEQVDEDLQEVVEAAKEKEKEKDEEEEKKAEQEEREAQLQALTQEIRDQSDEIEEENRRIRRMTEDLLEGEAETHRLETVAAPDDATEAADMAIAEIGYRVIAAGAEEVPAESAKSPEEVHRELQAMMDKMKLLAEDIKGAAVDSVI